MTERGIARNMKVNVSSFEGDSFSAQNLRDGRAETIWSSEYSDNQWVVIDLGNRKKFTD